MSLATYAFGQSAVDEEKWEIVDWYGKNLGEPKAPDWIRDMLKGNAVPYCQAKGLTDSIDRKFFLGTDRSDINLENARTEADKNTLHIIRSEVINYALEAIYGDAGYALVEVYGAYFGNRNDYLVFYDEVWKAAGLDLSSVRREGEFWQKIRVTESNGRVRTEYQVWSFFSISSESAYYELLKKALEYFLQTKGLDNQAKSVIAAQKVQEIKSKREAKAREAETLEARARAYNEKRREELDTKREALKQQLEFENKTDGEKGEIVDWYGRVIAGSAQPSWMPDMLRGNGVPYCQANGLTDSIDRRFIVPSCAIDISLENARAKADRDTLAHVGMEIADDICSYFSIHNSLTYIQRNIVRDICMAANINYPSVRREGEFWQRIRVTESNGRVRTEYYAWSFYSLPKSTYIMLVQTYLEILLKSKDLDSMAKKEIGQKSQEIIDFILKRNKW